MLIEHCYECHSTQASKVKGGLLLDSKAGWSRGGDSGQPAIIPGEPDRSLLIQAVRHTDPDLAMPPRKPKLPENVQESLVAWVKMGAPDPRDESESKPGRADKSWWSLQPLADPPLPAPVDLPRDWAASPIDRFVYARLTEHGLQPNPPADRLSLLRRVTYDLTGLPPTPEEAEEFQASADPRAYEKLVERLLASPRYGERWGRHWLDVVRFGESRGFERNEIIPNAWPFRDYVIRSFNEDKPFNRFIVEHLAGDTVGRHQPAVEVGAAYLTLGPYDDVGNQDAVAAANIRAATVDEIVSTTGAAFLGLTIGCARCHHHKFDPIPTEDYYRVKAAFDGVSHGARPLVTAEEKQRFDQAMQPLQKRRQQYAEEKTALEKAILERTGAILAAQALRRPPPSAHQTEERFAPTQARQVRFTVLSHSGNPKSGVGARLDEFEVWTAEATPRNVALAENGGKVAGAAGNVAKDFDGAYSVDLVNDGKFSARWFVGSPPVLTVTLPQPEWIERIVFSHDRIAQSDVPVEGLGPCVTEYEIHVSLDGQHWTQVADSFDRHPFDEALARERKLRLATSEEQARLAAIDQQLQEVDRAFRQVPPLNLVWAGTFSQPKNPTVVFKGGDPTKPGDAVHPASLAVLEDVAGSYRLTVDAPESERRLALARWMASDQNPLTVRVLANRVWLYHFGAGIVDTPSDFGFLGGQPTHPELLDWLARRLQKTGWRLKPLHREIVLSQAYRQSAAYREEAAGVDKDARWLWRFPPRRLSAEEVRDTLLSIAGRLELTSGGPGFRLYEYKQDNVATYVPLARHGPETYRRAVYHQNARASVVDILADFDLPDNAFAAPRRANTTSPLQALTMLNHAFVLEMAHEWAGRVRQRAGTDPAVQIREAYRSLYQRPPTEQEWPAALALTRTHGLPTLCRALLNSNELLYLY